MKWDNLIGIDFGYLLNLKLYLVTNPKAKIQSMGRISLEFSSRISVVT